MTVSLTTVGASQKIHSHSLVDHPGRYDFHHDFVTVVTQTQMMMPFSGGGFSLSCMDVNLSTMCSAKNCTAAII